MAKRILIWVALVATGWATEVVPVIDANGTRYRDVKFGPVNQDQIVLFHSRGVVTVPVSSLPENYRKQFAPKPAPNAEPLPVRTPVTQPTNNPGAILEAMRSKRNEPIVTGGSRNDWTLYNQQRASLVVLDGVLVDKSTLSPLVGFLAKERASLSDGTRTYHGAAFDLAERKDGKENVAAAMELRPSLWNRTAERVFLVNYKPMTLPGALMKVSVVEIDPIDQWRTFKVGTDPSFEDWKRLPRR